MNATKHLIILAALLSVALTACVNSIDDDAIGAQINIIVENPPATRAIKTIFEPGDVIFVEGVADDEAEYTMQADGSWSTDTYISTFSTNPIVPITISATYGSLDDRPRTDALGAEASTADGRITLGIGAGAKPVWNINLRFEHLRPVADLTAIGTDGRPLTDIQTIRLTLAYPEGADQTILTTAAENILLDPGAAVKALEIAIAGITYRAEIAENKRTTLAAGKRYAILFTASPTEATATITPAPDWGTGATAIAGYDYTIATPADLKAYNTAMQEPANRSKTAIQIADITWDESVWTPVGDGSTPFTGLYNGNGYSIANLKIGGSGDMAGMFGVASGARLANIHLRGAGIAEQITAYVGLLVGIAEGNTTISRCSAQGTITCVDYNNYVGGLAGWISDTHITRCHAAVAITGNVANGAAIGGLTGIVYNSTSHIIASSANADIDITSTGNAYYAGGLVGEHSGGTIQFCYATGAVTVGGTGTSRITGGLIGYNNSVVRNSYATTDARGTDGITGSLVGFNNFLGVITSCHATGLANDAAGKPVAGNTHAQVSTVNSDTERYAAIATNSTAISGIRTLVIGAGGAITFAARTFAGTSVWTNEGLPGIDYGYEGD